MRFLTLALLCIIAWAATVRASQCTAQGGACWDDTQYDCKATGGFKTGLCPGGVHNRCCLGQVTKKAAPAPTTPATTPTAPSTSSTNQCTSKGGYCGVSAGNICPGGNWVTGLCPFNSNVKCCLRNTNFDKLRNCYPQGSPEEVKARLGGAVNADWITNTCAIRMSETLNCAGHLIRSDMGANTVGGSAARGSRRYVFRVRELAPIVKKLFGNGVTYRPSNGNRGVDPARFKGKRGIIMFDTTGAWNDASGHFDLWDGNQMVETHHANDETTQRYFSLSVSVTLWEFA